MPKKMVKDSIDELVPGRIEEILTQIRREFTVYPESRARAISERKMIVNAICNILQMVDASILYPNLISPVFAGSIVRSIHHSLKLE